jgi:hypothetical protein
VTYELAARAVSKYWSSPEDRLTMLSIGAAESGEFRSLHGDPVATLPGYAMWACEGFLSHGFLQVFVGVHHDKLTQLTGNGAPCVWARWLEDFDNCARAGKWVWDERGGGVNGFKAWSAYNLGWHLRYTDRARAALEALEPPGGVLSTPGLGSEVARHLRHLEGQLRASADSVAELARAFEAV